MQGSAEPRRQGDTRCLKYSAWYGGLLCCYFLLGDPNTDPLGRRSRQGGLSPMCVCVGGGEQNVKFLYWAFSCRLSNASVDRLGITLFTLAYLLRTNRLNVSADISDICCNQHKNVGRHVLCVGVARRTTFLVSDMLGWFMPWSGRCEHSPEDGRFPGTASEGNLCRLLWNDIQQPDADCSVTQKIKVEIFV